MARSAVVLLVMMTLVLAERVGVLFLPIISDSMADLAEAGQRPDVTVM